METSDNPTLRCCANRFFVCSDFVVSCLHQRHLSWVRCRLPLPPFLFFFFFWDLTNSIHRKLQLTVCNSASQHSSCVWGLVTLLATPHPRTLQTTVSASYFLTYWFLEGVALNFKWNEKDWFRVPSSGCLKKISSMWVQRLGAKLRCGIGLCV